MTDQEKFIELIESFGLKKSGFSALGEMLPMGKCGPWEYQVYPELPRDDDSIHVRLNSGGDQFIEFLFLKGKFLYHTIVPHWIVCEHAYKKSLNLEKNENNS